MGYVRVPFILICFFIGHIAANKIPPELIWPSEENVCRTPHGSIGSCIAVKDCKIIADFVGMNENLSGDVKNILRKYVCGVDSQGDTAVCCPPVLPDFKSSSRLSDYSRHPNINLLPTDCGIHFKPSGETLIIIGYGEKSNLFEFPWAAALKYDTHPSTYNCGGSLITDRYILTAAHCIKPPNKLISVRLGEYNFNTDPDCGYFYGREICRPSPQDFAISVNDAIIHPEYDRVTKQNDIALIRLRSPVNITIESVSPICLPITTSENKTRKIGGYMVAGWGVTETYFGSPILLKAGVAKVETPECKSMHKMVNLTENHLCASGRNEQDPCPGDSGGPLMIVNYIRGRFRTVQHGIVSFGAKICGREGVPAVYTRVDKYIGWILDNIRP